MRSSKTNGSPEKTAEEGNRTRSTINHPRPSVAMARQRGELDGRGIKGEGARSAQLSTINHQLSTTSIAIIGLGYVGLPLSLQFARSGVSVIGLDIDSMKVDSLNRG